MQLRSYQQAAVDAATAHLRRSIMPGLLDLATGAGKSLIVAEIAKWIFQTSGKRVLCLQPSAELTAQNHEKYMATGNKASIYSASAGGKCFKHPVVYGTPGTVKNSLNRFGDQFAAVIIDEAHGITNSIKMIVGAMRGRNPNLRVLGLTATPYRMRDGYIYQYDIDGSFMPEEVAIAPYFNQLLYRVTTRELIEMGYLTPAHAEPDLAAAYEGAGSIELNSQGKYNAADLERVFEGRGRLTSQIVSDVVSHAQGRRGVMLFAATVQHAQEIMESLPAEYSRMLGGTINMKKAERRALVEDFKAQKFKYLVSVATLTTGFDAPHVDLIAVLRATESPGLFQQIIGRGLRLYDGKEDCLVLDYAENIKRFDLQDDLFTPDVKAKRASGGGERVPIICPICDFENQFILNPEYIEMDYDRYGYVLDLEGNNLQSEYGPIPSHFGRRCTGQDRDPAHPGAYVQCSYRWTYKECPECGEHNDIAARYCVSCKHELVDPNEKLQRDFVMVKKDPYAISTDEVISWSAHPHTTQSGMDSVRCDYQTEYRSFPVYYNPWSKHPDAVRSWVSLSKAVYRGHVAPDAQTFLRHLAKGTPPKTITYRKNRDTDFFEARDHNRPADVAPIKRKEVKQ